MTVSQYIQSNMGLVDRLRLALWETRLRHVDRDLEKEERVLARVEADPNLGEFQQAAIDISAEAIDKLIVDRGFPLCDQIDTVLKKYAPINDKLSDR